MAEFDPYALTLRSAFYRQRRVLGAVMLRNIRTRFFGHGLGYLIAIAWPLSHILIIVAMAAAFSRAPGIGDNNVVFIATGTVPFMMFSYLSRFMMISLLVTRPLLSFPEVKSLDVLFASALLEILSTCVVTLILIVMGWAFDVPFWPRDIAQTGYAIGSALLLGIGLGIFNGVITLALPFWFTVYSLLTLVLWLTSGVSFLPMNIPEGARVILAYNPIIHSVEWMRVAFYDGYVSPILDKTYVISFGVASIAFGLLLERTMRGYVLASR